MKWHKVLLHLSAASSIIGKCSQWNKKQMPQMLGSSFQISALSLMLAHDFHCLFVQQSSRVLFQIFRSNMSSCPQREGWSHLLSSPLLEAEICMCYSQHKFNNNSFFRHQEIRASNMLPLAAWLCCSILWIQMGENSVKLSKKLRSLSTGWPKTLDRLHSKVHL